jgi:hypothetical protein
MKASCISLLTDFGLCDEYVGVMKGVIASRNPQANVIDICHNITPQNVVQAAFMLWASHRYFPKKTIHVVVVDPGVGSDRHILALKANNYFFLAPDNGVLTFIINKYNCLSVYLSESQFYLPHVSNTFHGRDIFAPVAAQLSIDSDILKLGKKILPDELVKISDINPVQDQDQLVGKVIMADRFGNLITNISQEDLQFHANRTIKICIKQIMIQGIAKNYMQVQKGELLAIIGSKGLLEISINCGNAKQDLGIDIGSQIRVIQTNN